MSRSPITDRRITVYLSDDDIGRQMLDVILATPDYQKSKMIRQWLRDGMIAHGLLTMGVIPVTQVKSPRHETDRIRPQRTRRLPAASKPAETKPQSKTSPQQTPPLLIHEPQLTEAKPLTPPEKPPAPKEPVSNANDPYMGLWNM